MSTGLFSFSCTLCVARACLSVCLLSSSAKTNCVTGLKKDLAPFLGEWASFNLSCTELPRIVPWPVTDVGWQQGGRRGKSWLCCLQLWEGKAGLLQGRAHG